MPPMRSSQIGWVLVLLFVSVSCVWTQPIAGSQERSTSDTPSSVEILSETQGIDFTGYLKWIRFDFYETGCH
jgi:hypothetical protein